MSTESKNDGVYGDGRTEVGRPGARTQVFMQSRNNPVHFYVMLCADLSRLLNLLDNWWRHRP